jgi:oxygen-independent coproporphyrinogen-3 oxidase
VASLYVHIPWCLSRCPYCDFNTYAARSWPEEAYAESLRKELDWFASLPPFAGAGLETIFFGGGTPSLFEPATIGRLLEHADRRLSIAAEAEITLEANPGTVDEARLAAFRSAGVNRLSLGVQTFRPRLLEALGRRHSVDESREALRAARAAGFGNLSLDLIYAVPGQTLEELEADLEEAVSFAPDHVSAYALTYESGTPLHRDLQAGRVRRAPEELEVTMFERVRERLAESGYAAYEISNHARPGREARHNQAYWRYVPYLGLGAGAHSFAPVEGPFGPGTGFGVRWQNERDPSTYRSRVATAGHAVVEREELRREQAMGEFCWLGLRESRGLDPVAFAERFGAPLSDVFPHAAELAAEDLLETSDGRLVLGPRGLLVADSIFASFFG